MQVDYKDILFMPVDLPKFDQCDQLVADFNNEFSAHTAQAFESQRLLETTPDYGISRVRSDLTPSQNAAIEYIQRYLPFTDLVNIKINHMHRQGGIHIDMAEPKRNKELYEHNKLNEPCGYRMVIQGNRYGDLGVVTDDQVIKLPTQPQDTDWYVIQHTHTKHANVRYVDDRYILFCHGWMDKDKNEELLQRSILKYQNDIIYKFDQWHDDEHDTW